MEKVFLSQRKESEEKERKKFEERKNHLCTRLQNSYRFGLSGGANFS